MNTNFYWSRLGIFSIRQRNITIVTSYRSPCIAPQNMGRTFFIFCFVSTISTKILLLWKMLKKHWRLKNILLLGIALIYGVAIYGRRINSDRKKVLFLKNFYDSPREKFSKRRTYSLDPFYQHYLSCSRTWWC